MAQSQVRRPTALCCFRITAATENAATRARATGNE